MENQPAANGFDTARLRTLIIGCLAALAGLMAGLDIGVISGALDLLAQTFHASTVQQEWIVSAMMGGAAVGSLCGGWMSHQIGRKHALLVGAAVFVAGSLACALAWSIPSMIVGRLIMGLAIGVAALPYSPRWLMMRGRRKEALDVLVDLRDDRSAAMQEIQNISRQLQQKQRGWSLLRHNSNFRRSIFLGMTLQVMQQLAGVNVVMYYAPKIFALAGYIGPAQLWCTAMVGLVNMLATFIAIGLVDRWGRKPILYTGFVIMAVGMGCLGFMLNRPNLGQTEQIISVFMLLIYISGFAMSAGPLIWVLCSEVQPLQGRDLGISISTLTNWIANMIVGASFLSLLQWMGNGPTFWLFAGFNLIFVVVTWRFIPETRDMSLEKIEQRLMAGLPLREIGQGEPLPDGR